MAGGDDALPEGVSQPEQIGNTLIVVPAIEAQRLVRLQLYRGGNGSLALTLRPTETQRNERAARLAEQEAPAAGLIDCAASRRAAEAGFVRATETDLERTRSELAALRQASMRSNEAYAEAELVAIGRSLPRDPTVAQAMKALDRRVGEANWPQLERRCPPAGTAVPMLACPAAWGLATSTMTRWRSGTRPDTPGRLRRWCRSERAVHDCVHCHRSALMNPAAAPRAR